MKRLYVLLLLAGLLAIGVSVSQAETYGDWYFEVSPSSLPIACNANGSFTFRFRVNYDLPSNDIFQVFTARHDGVIVYSNPVAQPFSGIGAVNGIWNGGAGSAPITVSLSWVYSYEFTDFYYSNITFTCANGAFSNITYTNSYLFLDGAPDDRINYRHGDLDAAAYVRYDEAGNPALHVYCIDADNHGFIGLILTEDELESVAPAAGNTLIAQTDDCSVPVAVYRLSGGEYQLNIGPDSEGKLYEIIWTGMPITNLHYNDVEVGDG